MHCLAHSRDNISKDKAEDIADDQSAQNVRDEVYATQQALAADPAVQSHCQKKTQHVNQNRAGDGILKGEQIGMQHTFVGKQVDIVPQTHKVKRTIATVVGKAVHCTGNQRQRIKQEKQNHNRNGHCQKRPVVAAQCFFLSHDAFSSSYFCTFAMRSRL